MTLARRFDELARAQPDRRALVSSRGALTYGELRHRVDGVARALRARGVVPASAVGVSVARSLDAVVAVLGVLRAGAAYVPIDPAYPAERQRLMATDAGLTALIVNGAPAAIPDALPAGAIVDLATLGPDAAPLPPPGPVPGDVLNILFTSGSTGRPKGVIGTHAAMLNRLRWGWDHLPFAADEVVGHRSSLSFVDAGPEMFGGLLAGVPTAVLLPEETADLARLIAALRDHGVTRLTVVPSILAALVRSGGALGDALGQLRTWITSGEELTLPLLRGFRAAHPAASLINLYGTTEVTGDCTCAVFPPDAPLPTERVPIGAAIAGAELLVLDPHGRPVPDGEPGELHVGGPVLARGYHQRPQEEAVRFPRHPTRPDQRVFRTGDVVRRDPGGALLFLGRVDNVVKIRGVRIELEEIERVLRAACAALDDIAVVAAEGQARLVAFVTPPACDVEVLRAAAERLLPDVMRPARFVPLDALPLLPNGKWDRRALAAQVSQVARSVAADRQPRTASERRIAAVWASLLQRHDLAIDDTFAALGGDSLRLAELMLALERVPGGARVSHGLARDGTLADVARALDGEAPGEVAAPAPTGVTLAPLGEAGARDPRVVALLVEASLDPALCANTELPGGMDEDRARAYCAAADGVVICVDGEPAGAAIVQHHPNVGTGVEVPAGGVQLDEWLLSRWRGQGLLAEGRAWPLLAAWLAQRFDTEVSVVWEDHLAMIAILRARGYTRIGRSYWESRPDGDGTAGFCEVWTYDLRPHRRA